MISASIIDSGASVFALFAVSIRLQSYDPSAVQPGMMKNLRVREHINERLDGAQLCGRNVAVLLGCPCLGNHPS